MDAGFVKLWRKSQNSRVFQNAELWKIWTWCLMRANHKENWVSIKTGKGDIEVLVGPGQFVFGRHSAAEKLRMKPSSVRNRMKKLENMENLTIQQDKQYSIVTVCNWDTYQPPDKQKGQPRGQAKDRQRTGKGQAKDTEKNDKNYKNEENKEKEEICVSSDGVNYYLTKRNRKLNGGKLEWFNLFWKAFGLPKGKADAADAWLDIKGLDETLFSTIVMAAEQEAINRSENKKPKWAQGWLNSKRWEDGLQTKDRISEVFSEEGARTVRMLQNLNLKDH